jgi:hypothetical protein
MLLLATRVPAGMPMRANKLLFVLLATVLSLIGFKTHAADLAGCERFDSDVSRELQIMQQAAQPVTAAARADSTLPSIEPGKAYELTLVPAATTHFVIPPAKMPPSGGLAGLVSFKVGWAGVYRVSLNGGYWIDVLDGTQAIESRAHSGSHDCKVLHKVVEFELPAGHVLVLQLSGTGQTSVRLAITPAKASPQS